MLFLSFFMGKRADAHVFQIVIWKEKAVYNSFCKDIGMKHVFCCTSCKDIGMKQVFCYVPCKDIGMKHVF